MAPCEANPSVAVGGNTENTFTPSPVEGCGPTGSAELKMFVFTGAAIGSSDECLMALQLRVESIAASP